MASFSACTCSKTKESEANPTGSAEAQKTADLALLPSAGGSVEDQLAAEKAARPSGTPRLEDLTTALSKSGVTVTQSQQALGRKLLAIYCASAHLSDGLILTVCEYPTAAQAGRGKAELDAIARAMPMAQTRQHKQSVLQLVKRSDTPQADVDAALEAFDSL